MKQLLMLIEVSIPEPCRPAREAAAGAADEHPDKT